MNCLIRKTISTVLTFLVIAFFLFNFNHFVKAEENNYNVDVTLNYLCGINFPGLPKTNPWTAKLTANSPNSVAPGQEFYLTNTKIFLTTTLNNSGDTPRQVVIEGPSFSIETENKENVVVNSFSDFETSIPAGETNHTFYLNGESSVELGPFIAGETGEVILKSHEISVGVKQEGAPLSTGMVCDPVESQNVIATIPIDDEAPVIQLNGDDVIEIKRGDSYEELGAVAIDNVDGDISEKIEISGDVDTTTIGEYIITYTVSDSVGNVATAERIVKVVEPFGSWLTGEGLPSDELGSNGDLYLDTATGDIYKRHPNTWTKIGNLKGDDGKQGTAILTGSGAPSADAGKVGDLYFDTKSGDVYEKTAEGWGKIANLQGPEGPQGPAGSSEPIDDSASKDVDGSGKKADDGTKATVKGDDDGKGSSTKGGKLPKTATSLPTLTIIGTLLATVGGLLFLRRRKAIE